MSHVVVLGAGLGGVIMAYEMKAKLGPADKLTVVNLGDRYLVRAVKSLGRGRLAEARGHRRRSRAASSPSAASSCGRKAPSASIPAENRIELNDGTSVDYDYLIIATGPDLAFDEIPGLGPDGNTQSICHIDHAEKAKARRRCAGRSPAVRSSSAPSRARPASARPTSSPSSSTPRFAGAKTRDRVPMTFVTPEPYIGHLGLDGVGDTKGLLESALRERHIKWITNAKVTKVEPGKMFVEEVDDAGAIKATPRAALRLLDDAAGLPRHRRRARHRGADQSARLHRHRQVPAQSGLPERLRASASRWRSRRSARRRFRSACRRPAS